MFATVLTVNVDDSQDRDQARNELREKVAPGVSRAPGFVSGIWLAPGSAGEGLSVVAFDSEEAANAGLAMVKQMFETGQTPPGVTMRSVEVREVMAKI